MGIGCPPVSHGAEIFFGNYGNHLGLKVHDFDDYGVYANEDARLIKSFSSQAFADATIAFLENRPRGKPFFAYVSFTAPHDPRNPPVGSQVEAPNLPKNFLPQHPFDNGGLDGRDEKILASPLEPDEVRREWAGYYGMIKHMDQQIGRIVEALESTGVRDNTVIVFTSDNGLALGSHGMLGKQNLYEHSTRIPLIFSGPGIQRDQDHIAMCYQMDILPTICDLTGTKIPGTIEGKSLMPILKLKASRVRSTLFAAYGDQQRSVRDYRFKLIFYPKSGRYQLFNLRSDPVEMNNLFDSGKHGREINRLRIQLGALQTSLQDPLR